MGFHQTKTLLHSTADNMKDNLQRRKIFVNYTLDTGLVFRAYKALKQLSSEMSINDTILTCSCFR